MKWVKPRAPFVNPLTFEGIRKANQKKGIPQFMMLRTKKAQGRYSVLRYPISPSPSSSMPAYLTNPLRS